VAIFKLQSGGGVVRTVQKPYKTESGRSPEHLLVKLLGESMAPLRKQEGHIFKEKGPGRGLEKEGSIGKTKGTIKPGGGAA